VGAHADPLLTPDTVSVLTDYQPEISAQVKSTDPKLNGHYDIWCYLQSWPR
jgi:hypothetical protein